MSAEKTAISAFCSAQTKRDRVEEEFESNAGPFREQVRKCRETLRTYMLTNKLTCVRLPASNDGEDPMYMRMTTSHSINPIEEPVIKDAIDKITVAELRDTFQSMKKTKEPYTMENVWQKCLEDQMRALNSSTSVSFSITETMERGFNKANNVAPPRDILMAAADLRSAQVRLSALSETFANATSKYDEAIEEQTPVIISFLEKTNPEKLAKTLNISTPASETKQAVLTCKRRSPPTEVRITVFKPVINSSLQSVFKRAAVDDANMERSVSPEVKRQIYDKLMEGWTSLKSAPRKNVDKLVLAVV